ncbi:hypothetical protein [Anabaena azotica]|uniref:Uncharacterized protein n=1 Tax=Anabaena azotica FACHB-119 TaxID=947527 RepID=A0ABR8D1Z0_9NOST|nr:hypothetical protein [Anabaena azotica]MBD2501152.1 hypothetical protein [Anabaena azotica FACHB-119]
MSRKVNYCRLITRVYWFIAGKLLASDKLTPNPYQLVEFSCADACPSTLENQAMP